MAQNASKIFSGPISQLTISNMDGTNLSDLGFSNGTAEITWEPRTVELMDGGLLQLSGIGKVNIELLQTDTATINVLKGYRDVQAKLTITAFDSTPYTISGVFIATSLKRSFKPGEPHILTLTAQKETLFPDEFCSFPA